MSPTTGRREIDNFLMENMRNLTDEIKLMRESQIETVTLLKGENGVMTRLKCVEDNLKSLPEKADSAQATKKTYKQGWLSLVVSSIVAIIAAIIVVKMKP